ncbi:hypothetical protein BH10BAC4_BH10BAC4_25200 [soil metagenome]
MTSDNRKKLKGTFQKCRATKSSAHLYQPLTEIPEPPDYFGEVARLEWNTLFTEMIPLGVLEVVDLPQLRSYCFYVELIEQCARTVSESKTYTVVITNKGGHSYSVPHPCVQMINSATLIVSRIASKFGLNPHARLKVLFQKPDAVENDPFLMAINRNSNKS